MSDQTFGASYSRTINALIFVFPIVINSLQVAGDIILFILAMIGIFISISKKISPFRIKEIRVFSYLTFGYFVVICLSVVFSGQMKELAHYIPRDFYFLFAPFIALSLFKAEININYLLAGVKCALIILGLIILNQSLAGYTRPSGVMNPAVFGNLSVSLFFIAIIFFESELFKNKLVTLVSLFSGFYIILSSGTRGAWLSFILLVVVYLYFFYKKQIKISPKARLSILLIFIISILVIVNSNQFLNGGFSVFNRVTNAYSQVVNWDQDDLTSNAVSERLMMYKKALDNITDVPFFGHGLRTSNITLYKNDHSVSGVVAARYNHLHNAYLTNYYNGGILLLIALLLLLFIPLIIFLKANKQDRQNPVFISGAFLTLGYASYGMVNILFGDTYMNGFYVFFLAIFLLQTNKAVKN